MSKVLNLIKWFVIGFLTNFTLAVNVEFNEYMNTPEGHVTYAWTLLFSFLTACCMALYAYHRNQVSELYKFLDKVLGFLKENPVGFIVLLVGLRLGNIVGQYFWLYWRTMH